ncbi:DUF6653 family protein [Litoribrevibacter euphylliae]|uniref:DUF6653 family protein n=1 Tax=Litoribrevibacter euphylliae TaxID=1834034 RepID=A0ABV7HH06_9GAMM
MDETTWAQHANPWSVYSRFTILPLLSFALYSREWLGWGALIPLSFVMFWIWYNPRAFNAPKSTNNWASKGTFGERIYLRKAQLELPKHHLQMANVLLALTFVGMPILIYALYINEIGWILFGNAMVMLPKAWFVDRMVWLYEDMKDSDPEFQSWLKD